MKEKKGDWQKDRYLGACGGGALIVFSGPVAAGCAGTKVEMLNDPTARSKRRVK